MGSNFPKVKVFFFFLEDWFQGSSEGRLGTHFYMVGRRGLAKSCPSKSVLWKSLFYLTLNGRSEEKYLHTTLQCVRLRNKNCDYLSLSQLLIILISYLLFLYFLAWDFPRLIGYNSLIRDKTLRKLHIFVEENHLHNPEVPDRDLTFS